MRGFLKFIRSSAKLAKANVRLSKGQYKAAAEAAKTAIRIGGLPEQSLPLCHSILGKALYHLNHDIEALENLNYAEELLTPSMKDSKGSNGIVNEMLNISWYINKIEKQTHNKKRNEMDGSVEPPIR